MRMIIAMALSIGASIANADTQNLTADVWVDNWFAMYANGELVIEDSVSITTERSFNAETTTFSIETPAVIAIVAKDFKENDSGLEYIGKRKQQMGDGGLIAQFRDADSGKIIAVTDDNMRCLVVHRAPLDVSCAKETNPVAGEGACAFEITETPSDWMMASFDDSKWPAATIHSESDVSPKQGYDRISWDSSAQLIWSDDLVQDNTILCRLEIGG